MDDGAFRPGYVERFDIQTPASPAERRRNVEHALSLGLPELAQRPDRGDPLAIVANGPSARDFPICRDHRLPRLIPDTIALNGALELFREADVAPEWWAACDPQALVADFLEWAPLETTYLIASTCHADVFEALRNRHVLIWHLSDDDETQGYHDLIADRPSILRGSSITLAAFGLADALGFPRTEVWGWDGCLRGTRDHATDQRDGREVQLMQIGDTFIPTTKVWIYELMGAAGLLKLQPRDLTIHGDGMFARALSRAGLATQQEHP